MKRTIEITVGLEGQIQIEALNFKGADCEQATRYLEEALGTAGRKTRKPDYYRCRSLRNQQKAGS